MSKALLVLKVFYKQAAKAKVFVLALLEVIVSDFERTIKNTSSAEEAKEAAEFVEFDRTSKADIGGKETKTELDEQDLETTKTTIKEKMEDMQTNMDLVDKALEELDTGMSYEERVEKREEEIAALKKALCILESLLSQRLCSLAS